MGQSSEVAAMGFEACGKHDRIFTKTEERAISDHIIDTYLSPGRLFTDATFVEVAGQLLTPFSDVWPDSAVSLTMANRFGPFSIRIAFIARRQ
jgi:hypothetical protein